MAEADVKPTARLKITASQGAYTASSAGIDGAVDFGVKLENIPGREAVTIKSEEPEYYSVDATIPNLEGNDDFFDDSEGEEEVVIVDETYEGLLDVAPGVQHFQCHSLKIPQVPEPQVEMVDLKSLFGCLDHESIVLSPHYQREVVWDEYRASTLVRSIAMGYFVPPIIFNRKIVTVKTSDGKNVERKMMCVDGKQRLTALYDFMKGRIGILDSGKPPQKWYFCHPTDKNGAETTSNHNIMPSVAKDFIENKRLCCYFYKDLPQDIEENMFQLVQRGVPLTPAEKMRAMSTEWATFAKQYVEDYSIVVNLSKNTRAGGFRSVLTIFSMIQEVLGKSADLPAPTLQASPLALTKFLEEKQPINMALKLALKSIFDRFEGLVSQSSTQFTATKYEVNEDSVFYPAATFLREDAVSHVRTFSPLELICTAVLIAYHMDGSSDEELLNGVKNLRRYLRLEHKDLRVNPKCWSTAWNFISKMGTNEEPSTAVPSGVEPSGTLINPVSNDKVARKAAKRAPKSTNAKGGSRVKKSISKGRRNMPAVPLKASQINRRSDFIRSESIDSSSSPSPPPSDDDLIVFPNL